MVIKLLPERLRRHLLALAEIGHEAHRDLKLALLAERRSVFIDVGANRGQFARFMSSFFERVVVFEPIERFAAELKAMLAPNCAVHRVALADFTGPATFYVPSDGDPLTTQTASLITPATGAPHQQVEVEVRRLDDFRFDEVSFIKVDIEGAEYAFLQGAVATLRRCRPVLLIEIEDRHTQGKSKRVFDLLAALGYRAFISRDPRAIRASSALRRLVRGMAYAAAPRRIELLPIDPLLARIQHGSGKLNQAFGTGYVNNFLFLPSSD